MRSKLWNGLLLLVLSGCGYSYYRQEEIPMSLDGVKLLDRTGATPEEQLHTRDSYLIDADHRLLLRLENFSGRSIYNDTDKPLLLQVTLVEDPNTPLPEETPLRLCPLKRNWMMLANWTHAHPFAHGQWITPGGDFNERECLKRTGLATFVDGAPNPRVQFDIQQWYVDHNLGRNGQNYGFALISDTPTRVYGELSGSDSPRMLLRTDRNQDTKRPLEGLEKVFRPSSRE